MLRKQVGVGVWDLKATLIISKIRDEVTQGLHQLFIIMVRLILQFLLDSSCLLDSVKKSLQPFWGDTRVAALVYDSLSMLCHCKLFFSTLEAISGKVYSVTNLFTASPMV